MEQTQEHAQDKKPRVSFPKIKLTVTKNNGYCYHNYKVGDEFIFEDFTHPPKNFCLGIAHSAFPCMYALTFGGTFPFEKNTKSIHTTCPDGGKMEFLIEILDENGNVIVQEQKEKPKGPNPKDMVIEVEEKTGFCHYQYEVGQQFKVKGLKTPEGFCGAAYHLLFPVLFGMNFGATFSFEKDPNCKTQTTCPDGGKIKFSVKRVDSANITQENFNKK